MSKETDMLEATITSKGTGLSPLRVQSGFAGYLIGLRNARAGCDHTVTFDRALKAHPSFTLL